MSGIDPHAVVSPLESAPDLPRSARSLHACLAIVAWYAWAVAIVAGGGLAIPAFGGSIADFRMDALYAILVTHLCVGVVASLGLWRVRGASSIPMGLARLTLASMPLIALGSCDRLMLLATPPVSPGGGSVLFETHPRRDWALRPNAEAPALFVKLNAHGLRGSLIPFEKRSGERRVVILGDSVAFGFASPHDECFDRVLARQIGADGIDDLTVVNLSVPGYAPWQEIDVLRHEALRYDPDLILYAFCLNDVTGWFWRNIPRVGPPPFQNGVYERSGLLRFFRTMRHNYREWSGWRDFDRQRYTDTSVLRDIDTPGVREMWSKTLEQIRAMVAVARDHNRPIAFILFPRSEQVDPGEVDAGRPQRRLAAMAEELDVPVLDLLETFRAAQPATSPIGDRLFFDKWHLTRRGHQVTATALHAFLVRLGFLTGSASTGT